MFHFRNAKTFCFDIFKVKLNDFFFLRNSMDCFVITWVKEKGTRRKLFAILPATHQHRKSIFFPLPAILPTNLGIFCFTSHCTDEFPSFSALKIGSRLSLASKILPSGGSPAHCCSPGPKRFQHKQLPSAVWVLSTLENETSLCATTQARNHTFPSARDPNESMTLPGVLWPALEPPA